MLFWTSKRIIYFLCLSLELVIFPVPQLASTNMDILDNAECASEVKFAVFSIISKGGSMPQSIFHVLC
jgi:hypothetical protein